MTLTGNTALDQSIAGLLSGALSTSVLHPLDLVKVRFQVSSSSSSLKSTLRPLWQQSGFKGIYRGLSPNLTGSMLSWGLYFGFYSLIKDASRSYYGVEKLSPTHHLVASAEAGMSFYI